MRVRPLIASSRDGTIDATETWDQLRARIPETPETATVKGLFLREIIKAVPDATPSRSRYLPFSAYPVREYLDLILCAAQALHPEASPGTAVLRLALSVYAVFADSLAGSAIFSVAGRDFRRAIELSPKAYAVTLKPGHVNVLSLRPGHAVCELRNVWPFPDIFHAGIWIGALRSCGAEGTIAISRRTLCDVDFEIEWGSV